MQPYLEQIRRRLHSISKRQWKNLGLLLVAVAIFLIGALIIWVSTFKIPTLQDFSERQVVESTKIYDKTGQILLYDANQNTQRTVVPFDQISQNVKNATLAIEDKNFYQHGGVDVTSFFRALLADITTLSFSQGGSTITQQVIKNSLLSSDKAISRKLKEIVLAIRLEQIYSKDQILDLYLNEIPYGGTIYGVEEASQSFFGVHAADLSLAQSAYLAALPQAPSYYSPYGAHTDKLEERKSLVLQEMLTNKFVSQDDYNKAKAEKVTFLPQQGKGIKAPHFVFYVLGELEQKYGTDLVQNGGLKVITTLDYSLEQQGEQIANKYALQNEKTFNASNAAFVAVDPKTGGILAMVGSRNYFDKNIDGNFNIATAYRQPGSTFKPFVYSAAFNLGYTPDTVLFDVPTQFSTSCSPDSMENTNGCYSPVDYDGKYRGPMTLRDALAQSINIPSVEVLYLAGINNALNVAESMGIQSLKGADQYGLTLVLGGGEVSLLDMTSAYGVFANEGVRHPYNSILEVQDRSGNVLESYKDSEQRVLAKDTVDKISDILSDNVARAPAYGQTSYLYFPDRDVAVKTGTTNNYKDAWILGYTPSVVLGAWAGNNDNTPMDKKVAGFIVAPMWRAFMDKILATVPVEPLPKTTPETSFDLKPALRGEWQGGVSHLIDKVSGQNATALTPVGSTAEILSGGIHSILYWLNKDDPRGPAPTNPNDDPQFKYWEFALDRWLTQQNISQPENPVLPAGTDNVHLQNNKPTLTVSSPLSGSTFGQEQPITTVITYIDQFPVTEVDYFVNNNLIGKANTPPFSITFTPKDFPFITDTNTLRVVLSDSVFNSAESSVQFNVNVTP
jgi:1A family penicillin-binding protein